MNLLKPDSGEVSVFGLNYEKHEREIKQRIGFVYDEHVFYENLTLQEMKKLSSQPTIIGMKDCFSIM